MTSNLRLAAVTEDGRRFETGTPVEFPYYHFTTKAPYCGDQFDQDYEPKGKYVLHKTWDVDLTHSWSPYEIGVVQLKNPLVVEWVGYGDNGWKQRLADHFGSTGGWLRRKLLRAGYDAVVTIRGNETSEIVLLEL